MTKLYKLRYERGMTQRQLARAIGVSIDTIRKYEQERNDTMHMSFKIIVDLANLLKVPIDYLVDDVGYANKIRNLEKYRRFFLK